MRLHWGDGGVFWGVDVMLRLSREIWWAWPLRPFSKIPGVMWLMSRLYGWLAKRRHCWGGACRGLGRVSSKR